MKFSILKENFYTTIVRARRNMSHTRQGRNRKAWVYSDGSADVIIGYKQSGLPDLIKYDSQRELGRDWGH